jgi:multiple sugar transport system permease protein
MVNKHTRKANRKPVDLYEIRKVINIIIIYLVVFIVSIYIILPLIMIFFSSFKSNEEYMYAKSVFELPKSFLNWDNYKLIFEKGKLLLGFRNSAWFILIGSLGSVVMSLMVAYVINRFTFPCRKLILVLYLIMSIIPTTVVEVFRFKLVSSLGLYNTIWSGVILYLATNVVSIYIYLQAMEHIPRAIDESAILDGASYFRVFRSFIVPLVRPATMTVLILQVIAIYNDYFIPYLYMPDPALRTATKAVQDLANDLMAKTNLLSAGLVILMIPTVLIYIFLQKWIISGITSGSTRE